MIGSTLEQPVRRNDIKFSSGRVTRAAPPFCAQTGAAFRVVCGGVLGQATIVVVCFFYGCTPYVKMSYSFSVIIQISQTGTVKAWLYECQRSYDLFSIKGKTKPGCSRNIWDARFEEIFLGIARRQKFWQR